MKKYFHLIRVHQWYKNLLVFLALFFSGNILNLQLLEQTAMAFLSLSLISSAGYVINDLNDAAEDRKHPERKLRPLASGEIGKGMAGLVIAILLLGGGFFALVLGRTFLWITGGFFALSLVYTFALKKIIFADVLTIATLFVIRAMSGAIAIEVIVSPWLILVPFFLSLYLSAGKRYSELQLLGEKAGDTKKVLKEYSREITTGLMTISTTLLIVSYALYSFLSEHPWLIVTMPFALYTIFRYHYLIMSGSEVGRNPEKIIKDLPILLGITLWLLMAGLIIYY